MSNLHAGRAPCGEWLTLSCPDPLRCSKLANPTNQKCRDLAAVTDLTALSKHIEGGSEKEKFHALANGTVPLDWVLSFANLRILNYSETAEPVVPGILLNPNLCREGLPAPGQIGSSTRLAKLLLPYEHLIRTEDLAELGVSADEDVWHIMISVRNVPLDAYMVLVRRAGLLYLKRALAAKKGIAPELMAHMLSTPSPESLVDPSATFTPEARLAQTVARNPTLPMELIFTCPIPDFRAEALVLENVEARSDEATVWIAQNYPDFVDVPFEWVRQALVT